MVNYGPNQQFSVSGADVSGTVDYMVAPDMAVSEGVVMFTVHDEPGEWSNLMWKGHPQAGLHNKCMMMAPMEMKRQAINIWTALVAGDAGDHEWGAIDTDNGDGTTCEACDGTDGWEHGL